MKKLGIFLIVLNALLISLFSSTNIVNSDTVWSYLLFPHLFKNMVFLAPDTFVLHYPTSYLFIKLFGLNITTVFIDTFTLVFITIIGWLFYYFYFIKKYFSIKKILFILPAFFFINFSKSIYQMISIPTERNIEFSIALLLSIYFDNYLSLINKKFLKTAVLITMLLLFISDPYFIFVFALPLLLILLIKSYKENKYLGISILLLLTIVANTVVRKLLNTTYFFTLLGLSHAHIVSPHKVFQNVDLTIKSLLHILDSYPNLHIFSIFALPLFAIGMWGLLLMFKKGLKDNKHITLLFLPACFVFTILAYVCSGQPTDLETYRYLIFLVFLIPFGICYVISSELLPNYLKKFTIFCLIIMSLVNFFQMFRIFKNNLTMQQYQINKLVINTVQKYGLQYGYTSYWNAGINTLISNNTSQFRQVVCINHHIKPNKWLSSESWFDSNSFKGKTFLMIDFNGSLSAGLEGCSMNDITKQFGESYQIISISYENKTMSLVVFDYNIAANF